MDPVSNDSTRARGHIDSIFDLSKANSSTNIATAHIPPQMEYRDLTTPYKFTSMDRPKS
jgi:hypothetical protein